MFDLREEQERVILVGVQENGGANAEESLDELAELASTAGAKVEGRLVQATLVPFLPELDFKQTSVMKETIANTNNITLKGLINARFIR